MPKQTSEERQFIARSNCGFKNGDPFVCCPSDENELPKPPICGFDSQDFIYGGGKTKIDEYPWTALLIYKKLGDVFHFCGGSLINSRYVITGREIFLNHFKRISTKSLINFKSGSLCY